MRTLLAVTAALLLLSGCADDAVPASGPATEEPEEITLTPQERTDFLAAVSALGFTCRDALPDDPAYVACTRPGAGQEAYVDTVRLTATPTGEVERVSYCGPDPDVLAAFSTAFLSEIGSPPTLPATHETTGAPLRRCGAQAGGFAAGYEVTALLRELDLAAVRTTLTAAGWRCGDDPVLDCTRGRDDDRSLVTGAGTSLRISAPSGALPSVAADLGLDPAVGVSARACQADRPCDHLVVDGYDVTFTTVRDRTRMEVQQFPWL